MANPSIPDDLSLYIREQLTRIDLLHADAERKRQEMALAPGLYRLEFSKTLIAGAAALAAVIAVVVGLVAGLAGYKIGSTPPAPIIIQMPKG
jgi:hypothetical protein